MVRTDLYESCADVDLDLKVPFALGVDAKAALMQQIVNDLTFLRVRTKKHEIMVAPEKEFLLVVVQNPNAEQ